MFQLLIIEDDLRLRNLLCTILEKKGYTVYQASDGKDALGLLDKCYIDLIITDLMMPNINGFDFIKLLREVNDDTPILVITAKDSFEDKHKGFTLGADDYMVKPIDVNELILRIEALLRRAKITHDHLLTIGSTSLEYDTLLVTEKDKSNILPQKEFLMLYKLLSYPNKIFTRRQLMDEFWGYDSETDERTVDVHINRLRARFKENNDFELLTVRGLGYKAVIHE